MRVLGINLRSELIIYVILASIKQLIIPFLIGYDPILIEYLNHDQSLTRNHSQVMPSKVIAVTSQDDPATALAAIKDPLERSILNV